MQEFTHSSRNCWVKKMSKYIIKDWANNIMFNGKQFDDFEDAWGFIYENIPDEESYQDIYVEILTEGENKQ